MGRKNSRKDGRMLDISQPEELRAFETQFNSRVIGQPDAGRIYTAIYGRIRARVYNPRRPRCTVLLVGPTGVGKSFSARMYNYLTRGTEEQLEIYCDSFIHEGYATKVLGSSLGYRDSHGNHSSEPGIEPLLSQNNVNKYADEEHPALVLFDEVDLGGEKVLNLLLGIMENGQAQLGNNSVTDMSNTIIAMTTNAGAREMQAVVGRGIGFQVESNDITPDEMKLMKNSALEGIKKTFLPQFLNRIDYIIAFLPLDRNSISKVLDLELIALQRSLLANDPQTLLFVCGETLKNRIRERGFSKEYGARYVRKVTEDIFSPVVANLKINGGFNPETELIRFDLDATGEIIAVADGSVGEKALAELRESLIAGIPVKLEPASNNSKNTQHERLHESPALESIHRAITALERGWTAFS